MDFLCVFYYYYFLILSTCKTCHYLSEISIPRIREIVDFLVIISNRDNLTKKIFFGMPVLNSFLR